MAKKAGILQQRTCQLDAPNAGDHSRQKGRSGADILQFVSFDPETFSPQCAFRILRGTFLKSRAALCEPARIRQIR
jgi:hypothetical protein